MRSVASMLLVLAVVAPVATAGAQQRPAVEPSAEAHDRLFLRAVVGGSWAMAEDAAEDGTAIELTGTGGLLSLAVGGSVTERVVVFGDLYGVVMPGPSARAGGLEVPSPEDTWYAAAGVGIGVAHYFPSDLHLALSLGAATGVGELADEGRTRRVTTDPHPALHAVVGQEWSIARSWGLGVVADLLFVSAPHPDSDQASVHLLSLGLGVSLTYR